MFLRLQISILVAFLACGASIRYSVFSEQEIRKRREWENKGLHPDSTYRAVSYLCKHLAYITEFLHTKDKKRQRLPLEQNSVCLVIINSRIYHDSSILISCTGRQDTVNIMLLLLIALLYYIIFFSILSENIWAILTVIALVLLTIHPISAISSLLVFSSTHKLDSIIGDSKVRVVAFFWQYSTCCVLY